MWASAPTGEERAVGDASPYGAGGGPSGTPAPTGEEQAVGDAGPYGRVIDRRFWRPAGP